MFLGREYEKFLNDDYLYVNGFPELLSYGLVCTQNRHNSDEYQGNFKNNCKTHIIKLNQHLAES